ncbi:hypothetical protein C7T94_06675 [Pedobacter yulinensis]|uniref:Uncharacterized protein n=1 Tax=Pedobacter yulinensis TaxID=2126353 RepID=A0A2T3HPN4_9SPHI|nr:hypothetical protein C7T94_06675 [Pedobacter yulinensis]
MILACNVWAGRAQMSARQTQRVKSAMVRAIESSQVTDSLYKALAAGSNKDPLTRGYLASLEALKAKHAWNPYNKVKFANRSAKTMAEAIRSDPGNLELRFMRFSIQHYMPAFLGLSKDLDTDRREILKHYRERSFSKVDKELVRNIARFMIESGRCTGAEEEIFRKYTA